MLLWFINKMAGNQLCQLLSAVDEASMNLKRKFWVFFAEFEMCLSGSCPAIINHVSILIKNQNKEEKNQGKDLTNKICQQTANYGDEVQKN